jgi:hypothetical protein
VAVDPHWTRRGSRFGIHRRWPFLSMRRDPRAAHTAKDVLVKTAYHINDPHFAQTVIKQFRSVTGVPNEFLPRALSTEKVL